MSLSSDSAVLTMPVQPANANGSNGFGYDPVFYVPEQGKTFAELSPEEKNAISHRARALQEFCRLYEGMKHDK